ncbi:hypothetical protein E3T55_01815 [Cryobacterium frigoriphilum]|uniref:DUF3558 domain-containing protein n=1 Tax=Cryobacterium frigoriphilum TaxID=1259150 RepID=A0A4R9AAB6_9MICO|nr:hypothetical protein [Cryobacterium frigoriphilum]TFD55182.1 hypothetical protein E3T55_01815 [Cryobacterium frigoriphilum]
MLRRSLITPTIFLALVALSGCAIEPVAGPSGSASATPTGQASVEGSTYTCPHLATLDAVAGALAPADGPMPIPVVATQPAMTLSDYAVTALGGLDCSWRVGKAAGSPLDYPADSDWAYLSVKVVPGGADSWAPHALGDGPADTLTTIGGIESATGCGDPGCFISAPVGDAWVEITMSTIFFGISEGHFGGMTSDAILAQMEPFAASVFTALTKAEPGQLVWTGVDLTPREPACTGALKSQGIASALGVDSIEYEVFDSSSDGPIWFDKFVAQRAGLFTCSAQSADGAGASITVGYDLAGIVDTMVSQPDTSTALRQIALEGAIDGEAAVQICTDTSSYCTVIFSLGQSAYQVDSRTDAAAVAEAIIAQAR